MRNCLFTLACAGFLTSPMAVMAHNPSQIVVLGDSLSDSGNLPELILFPNPPVLVIETGAPKTDGTTWAVWLADALKTEWLLPSSQLGTNFAVAGALTNGTPPGTPPGFIPSLTTQVTQIAGDPLVKRGSPVFIWGGANDFIELGEVAPISPNQPAISAGNLGNIVQSMHDLGFKTQVVFNLPDLADVPSLAKPPFSIFNPNLATVGALTLEFNTLLADTLASKDFPVLGIDVNSLFTDIINNPAEYNFTNVTEGTPPVQVDITGTVVVPGSPTDGFLFYFDGEHPTHKAHRTLADFVYTTLRAPNYFGNLSQEAFSVSRVIMVNLRQQSFAVQPCHDSCAIYPFVNGSYEPLLREACNPHIRNPNASGGDVTYGVTYDFDHTWRVGVAGSYAQHKFKNKEHLSSFRTNLHTNAVSVFGNYQDCLGYVTAAFTASWHDFDKIRRKFHTGFATHTAKGKTHGKDYHGEIAASYLGFYCNDCFSTGPMIDLNYQWCKIDGYREKKSRIGNLQFKEYHNDQFATGLGWEARARFDYDYCCEPIPIIADAYVMLNRQWFQDSKDIRFRMISFGENYGEWPVTIRKRYNYISANLSLTACLCGGTLVNFGYNLNAGQQKLSEHVLTLGVSVPFGF